MDFTGLCWTIETEKALIFQGLLYLVGLSWIGCWWRCRDFQFQEDMKAFLPVVIFANPALIARLI